MAADTLSVTDLLDLDGEKMCVQCRHIEFSFAGTFERTTFVCASRCSTNYEKDCPCPGDFCEHTPLRSQCV